MARYDAVTQDLKDLGEEPYKFDKELPHETGNKSHRLASIAPKVQIWVPLCSNTLKLEYNGEHGARHLAPHPNGRGKHWRAFVEHLNALNLTRSKQKPFKAQEAFAFYKVILRETFGLPEGTEAPKA